MISVLMVCVCVCIKCVGRRDVIVTTKPPNPILPTKIGVGSFLIFLLYPSSIPSISQPASHLASSSAILGTHLSRLLFIVRAVSRRVLCQVEKLLNHCS